MNLQPKQAIQGLIGSTSTELGLSRYIRLFVFQPEVHELPLLAWSIPGDGQQNPSGLGMKDCLVTHRSGLGERER